jgi:hypothetical protein
LSGCEDDVAVGIASPTLLGPENQAVEQSGGP